MNLAQGKIPQFTQPVCSCLRVHRRCLGAEERVWDTDGVHRPQLTAARSPLFLTMQHSESGRSGAKSPKTPSLRQNAYSATPFVLKVAL
jgi:hypothetical protein